jgi:hypothetical protein
LDNSLSSPASGGGVGANAELTNPKNVAATPNSATMVFQDGSDTNPLALCVQNMLARQYIILLIMHLQLAID